MLHEKLWKSNLELARSCLTHPFVEALRDGSLETGVFSGYVAQDAIFLQAFVKAYALAVARSDEPAAMTDLHGLMGAALEELVGLHGSYGEELGIDLRGVNPNRACRAYTDFLLRTAWHASLAEILAAMTPCMRLYAYLGAELAPGCGERHPYRRWIETYSSKEMESMAGRMEALLDGVATETQEIQDCYRYAMQCELDFFSDAMEKGT